MQTRVRWLVGAGLALGAFAVWRICVYAPAPALGQYAGQPAKSPETSAPAPVDDYSLADDQVIRYIPVPNSDARARLLEQLRLAQSADVISLTVGWDGTPHFRSMEVGTAIVPRRLLHVLAYSLEIPLYRLEGIGVGRQIPLPGDWVVRAGADLDQCMSYVEKAVQQSGYPDFRIARRVQKCRGLDMRGVARAQEQPIRILPPHPDISPALPHTGTLQQFGEALSTALQRPVSVHIEPQDLKVTWQDNSRAYLDLGFPINEEMIAGLLTDVSDALGVTFAESDIETTVWHLELNE